MIVYKHSTIESDCNSLIIFDRDGTLTEDLGPMNGQSECILMPNVIEGLQMLSEAHPILAIATNQSYIGRKKLTIQDVKEFHEKLLRILNQKGIKISLIAICPHTPWQDCSCRKPKPGLLNKLITASKVKDRNRIYFVGDKESDREAAINAGIQGFTSDVHSFLGICTSIKSKLSSS